VDRTALVGIVALALGGGCASNYYAVPDDTARPFALDRAQAEYPECPRERVRVDVLAGHVMRLDVCGRTVVYNCIRGECVHDSWDRTPPAP
jgi:hypothetical protein